MWRKNGRHCYKVHILTETSLSQHDSQHVTLGLQCILNLGWQRGSITQFLLLLPREGHFPPWCSQATAQGRQEAGSDRSGDGLWWGLSSLLLHSKAQPPAKSRNFILTKYVNPQIHTDLQDFRAMCVWRCVYLHSRGPQVPTYSSWYHRGPCCWVGTDVLSQQAETEPSLVAENSRGCTFSGLLGSGFGKQHSITIPSNRP